LKTREKIAALRRHMGEEGLSACLVPSSDPHQSEYVPEPWKRRAWLSGFDGSAGEVLVTRKEAGLWTDGRYFLQAESQLVGSGVRLFRAGEPGVPTIEKFLAGTLGKGEVLGVDPFVISEARASSLASAVEASGAKVRFLKRNPVDEIWPDRPPLPTGRVMNWPVRFAGKGVAEKLKQLRRAMSARGADAHVVGALDAVAWLFNIRGTDVEYNPVVIAYAIVGLEEAELFVDEAKLPRGVRARLEHHVQIRPYRQMLSACRRLARRRASVWIDPTATNQACAEALGEATKIRAESPIFRMKAKKNPVERAGMRAAHARDGVAMVRFLCWLESAVPGGAVTEQSAARKLESFRAEGENFQGLSFPTIAGYGAHGAIIHYGVSEETDIPLRRSGLLLLDSGAQYLDGTTDITRTIALGPRVGRLERDRYTRVLKGHISLASARFPPGTPGARLDVLARGALWAAGLDYGHGTGHGVGAFLNVHEGPQSISFPRGLDVPLEVGNIQSNEPGFYEPGRFGIRIENLIEVVEAPASNAGRPFLEFETLTRCPIDTRPVDRARLSGAERQWINGYHRRVQRELSPYLDRDEREWLRRSCAPI